MEPMVPLELPKVGPYAQPLSPRVLWCFCMSIEVGGWQLVKNGDQLFKLPRVSYHQFFESLIV